MKFKCRYHYQDKSLRIKLDPDLLRFYLWQLYRSPVDTLGQQEPMYGAHITIVLKKLHGAQAALDTRIFHGKEVEVETDGYIHQGGSWFTNYWLKFDIPHADEIKRKFQIKDSPNFMGYHLTISNNKNRMNEVFPEAALLSSEMNQKKYNISEFREKMLKITKNGRISH